MTRTEVRMETETRSLVQDSTTEGAYAARTVLDTGTLVSVRHANDQFLALVARGAARQERAAALGLPRRTAERIAGLGPAARVAATRCPYSLFNLRFEDAAFWQALARDDRPGAQPACESAEFARTAVFLAWHLAQSSDLAAAIALGMTPDVQAVWRELPLPDVDRLAQLAVPQLRARWGGHARFWPKLLDAAEHPGPEQAERVRLLGLQLLAADGIRPQLARYARRGARAAGTPAGVAVAEGAAAT